jgi:hypothetical protein
MIFARIPRPGLAAILLAALVLVCALACGGETVVPTDETDMVFYRNPEFSEGYQNPLDYLPYPQHPFLAPNGSNNMHSDAYMSDSYEVSGPLGLNPLVTVAKYGTDWSLCVTVTFDSKGRIITFISRRAEGSYIMLIDPNTLETLASYPLPPQRSNDQLPPLSDTSGGAYFVLDYQDRVIIADRDNAIQIIRFSEEKGLFEPVSRYSLQPYVVSLAKAPLGDRVQMGLPDWEGWLWFTTRYGMVGTIDQQSGLVRTVELAGEEIQNSFTVGEDGVYVVSDHALYRFHANETGKPVTDWRTEYDRGSQVKPGLIHQGSGTTPHLFGDLVAICDNAEPRMSVLFLRRSDGHVVCQLPLFEEGQSATENAMPGLVREGPNGLEYSLVIENNYGLLRTNVFGLGGCCGESTGGLSRVDVVPDGQGGYTCQEIWTSPENSCSTVPKISLSSGLVYLYTYVWPPNTPGDSYQYYFTAIDFESGKTVFRVPVGAGMWYFDMGAPITLGPDGRTAYIGTLGGLIRISDAASS